MSVGKCEHQECPLLFRFISALEFRLQVRSYLYLYIYAMQPAISNDPSEMPEGITDRKSVV